MEQISKKQQVDLHVQRYVRAVMAERLRNEGFVSRDGRDIFWYRVIDNQVVQSVLFHTRWCEMPVIMDIGYGCHPLFLLPVFPNNAYVFAMTEGEEVFHPGKPLMKMGVPSRFIFDENTWISCPDDLLRGADILDDILAVLNSVKTAQDCYKKHEELYVFRHFDEESQMMRPYYSASADFMDEVVYWNDTRLYPCCEAVINRQLTSLAKNQSVRKLAKFELRRQERLLMLKNAIIEGNREKHLQFLEKQETKTIQLLERKVGIIIKK